MGTEWMQFICTYVYASDNIIALQFKKEQQLGYVTDTLVCVSWTPPPPTPPPTDRVLWGEFYKIYRYTLCVLLGRMYIYNSSHSAAYQEFTADSPGKRFSGEEWLNFSPDSMSNI